METVEGGPEGTMGLEHYGLIRAGQSPWDPGPLAQLETKGLAQAQGRQGN